MGNASSSAVQACLEGAVGNDVAFKTDPLFQLVHVKPYNLGVPSVPAAVTYPRTVEQVSNIVKCAVDNSLKVQARSGGHSYANYAIGGGEDNTIVVDLKNFQQFSMDQTTWHATVGGGTLLGDLSKRLHDNGKRAIAHGTCPQVGIGGHATIGGLGPASRMYGTTLDHVQEVEVVLANSSIVRASETQNTDVFFAVRGAAAGYGIVTEFKLRTQAEPGEAVLYTYKFTGTDSKAQATAFKKWQALISDPNLSRKFASQFIVTEQFGAIVTGTFFGSQGEFESLNISSRLPQKEETVAELNDWLGVVGHWGEDVALQIVGGVQANFYAKSMAYTKNDLIPNEGVDELFEYFHTADKGGAVWFIIWDLAGGAVNDVAPGATAYGHRDTLFFHQSYAIDVLGKFKDETRTFLTEVNNIVEAATPGDQSGAYAGFVDPALGAEQSASLYWSGNVGRLQKIKAEVDPNDVFHNPQSIRPARGSARMRR